ncbi:caspase-1-like [Phlebotomus argentipes]|uniref:caspase-1-like n=1 Tax=Phlebotomus argentipes TaxID=94469 RepID=UPI002892F00F|nr:caspase-1-like [Phlebotomus argentipes]
MASESDKSVQQDDLDAISTLVEKVKATFIPEQSSDVQLKSVAADSEYYDMTNKKRGVALIFNHRDFKRMPTRMGTNKDRDRMEEVFKQLGFETRVFNDLSRKELRNVLEKVAQEDHSDSDCLALIVMTHGETGYLYANDDSYKIEELWFEFMGNKCKSLIGKPKLFFVNACRGEKFDHGVTFSRVFTDQVDSTAREVTYAIPSVADILVTYSTFDGHYSWRNPENGSWFIEVLYEELKKFGSERDLLTLLTGVNRRVAYEYQSNVPSNQKMDSKKQQPSIVSMLNKILYFTPKKGNE